MMIIVFETTFSAKHIDIYEIVSIALSSNEKWLSRHVYQTLYCPSMLNMT